MMSTTTSTGFATGEFISAGNDYLICGSCQREFLLSDIMIFMQHKKRDCNDELASADMPLLCQLCPEKFITPWSLLQHAQNIHALKIYLESNMYNPGMKQVFKNLSNSNVSSNLNLREETPKRIPTKSSNAGFIPSISIHGGLVTKQIQTVSASGLENQPQLNVAAAKNTFDDNPKLIAVKTNLSTLGNNQDQILVSSDSLKMVLAGQNHQSKKNGSLALLSSNNSLLSSNGNGNHSLQQNEIGTTTSNLNHNVTQKASEEEPTLILGPQNKNQMPLMATSDNTPIKGQGDKELLNTKTGLLPMSPKDAPGQIITKEANVSSMQQAITYAQSDVGQQTDTAHQNKASDSHKNEMTGEEENQICCDDQDCGVTFIPGTHEELQKCCNAVAPKKRKRHMETKHMSGGKSKRKSSEKKHQSSTIYIDFEPSVSGGYHFSQSSFSQSGEKFLQRKDGRKSDNRTSRIETVSNQGSVTIHPGSAFSSIPISYTVSVESGPNSTNVQDDLNGMKDSRKNAGKEVSNKNKPKSNEVLQLETWPNNSTVVPSSEQEECKKENLNETNETSLVSVDGNQSHEDTDQEKGKKRRYPTSRPFKCDKCDYAFNQRIHLKKHQSKHTGIKPFKCGQCDYSTVERSHLKVHIRVHTGEKPFKCTYCEYATAQNSTLKIHLKRHHNRASSAGNQFRCTTCGKQFTQKDKLSVHSREHGQIRTMSEGLVIQTSSELPENSTEISKCNLNSPQSSLGSPDHGMIQSRHEDSENTNDS